MARRMGYGDRADNPAVERFMKRYFLVTKQVGSLTRILSARLELDRQKASPRGLSRFFVAATKSKTLADARFVEDRNRIGFANPKSVEDDLSALIDIFKLADQLDLDIDPSALALVSRLAPKGRLMRNDPKAIASFLDLVASKKDPARALGLLNESGLLGRLVPEFGRIVGQTQFNMYHHFTVDEHTLRGIANISDIENGRLHQELPVSTELFPKIANRRALYLAMLLHDVGKGEGDQQIEGAKAAVIACRRLGLDEAEVELVSWLVGHHLIMSEVAQRRDIGDPKTISDFATTVGTLEKLRLLLILTVADIRAVGPGVWNDWKAQLLRDLYQLTQATLRGGRSDERFVRRHLKAQADERRAQALSDPILTPFFTSLEDAYWLGFDPDQQIWHGQEIAKALHANADFWLASRLAPNRGATEILVYSPDQPGLFASLTAAFAHVGANVIDARVYTSKGGAAFDIFALQDQSGAAFGEHRPDAIERLFTRLRMALSAGKADEANKASLNAKKPTSRAAAFAIEPVIMIDNDGAAFDTILEISGRDRPGLLADLAQVFEDEALNVTSAHIDSVGERATDAFYLRDRGGLKVRDPRAIATLKARLMGVLVEADAREGPSLVAQRKLAQARASSRR